MLRQSSNTNKAVGLPLPRKGRSGTKRARSVARIVAAAAIKVPTSAPVSSFNHSVVVRTEIKDDEPSVVAPLEHKAEEIIAMRSAP
ncbi:hypothetical protein MMC07_009846, partial [Pseudocyphellaria aurata]|nr:hypothetical protein [Pseudocyphellaria aurata]